MGCSASRPCLILRPDVPWTHVILDLAPEQPNNTFEDAKVFGPDMYVYCASHVNPHLTGWCTVGVDNKLGLGIPRGDDIDAARTEALAKCRRLNLPLYSDKV